MHGFSLVIYEMIQELLKILKEYVSHFKTTHAASTIVMNLHLFVVAGVKSHCVLAIFLLTITFITNKKKIHTLLHSRRISYVRIRIFSGRIRPSSGSNKTQDEPTYNSSSSIRHIN